MTNINNGFCNRQLSFWKEWQKQNEIFVYELKLSKTFTVKSYKTLNPETFAFHFGLKVQNIYKFFKSFLVIAQLELRIFLAFLTKNWRKKNQIQPRKSEWAQQSWENIKIW